MSITRTLLPEVIDILEDSAGTFLSVGGIAAVGTDVRNFADEYVYMAGTLVEMDTQIKPDGSSETIYKEINNDPEHPATVRVGIYPGKARTNISVKRTFWMCSTDGNGAEVWTQEYATFATSMSSLTGFPNSTNWKDDAILAAALPFYVWVRGIDALANGLTRIG